MMRDYQVAAVDKCYECWQQGQNRIMLTLATGLGKSVIIEKILERWNFNADGRVIIVVHKRKLVQQLLERVKNFVQSNPQISYSVEMGFDKSDGKSDITVGTIQSISKRIAKFTVEETGLIIIDEAHHDTSKGKEYTILDNWSKNNLLIRKVGLTATLQRSDRVGYEDRYDTIAYSLPLQDGVEEGWLVKPIPYVLGIKGLTFENIRSNFSPEDIEKALTKDEQNLHVIASQIIRFCGDKKFLVFMPTKQSARTLCNILNGHPENKHYAMSIDCDASEEEREKFFRETGEGGPCRQLVGCDMLTEGYDCPDLEVIVLCTKVGPNGLGSLMQRVGRGTRPLTEIVPQINAAKDAEERKAIISKSKKPEVPILDLCGFSHRHRFVMVPTLFGKKIDKEVEKEIGKIASKGLDKPVRYDEIIEHAKDRIQRRLKKEEEDRLESERLCSDFYVRVEIEARKVLGMEVPKDLHKTEYKPGTIHPTPKQIKLLQRHGIYVPGMTHKEAKAAIMDLISGPATRWQHEQLSRYRGYDPNKYYDMVHASALLYCMRRLGNRKDLIKINRTNTRLIFNRESKRYIILITDPVTKKVIKYNKSYVFERHAVAVARRIADNFNEMRRY